MARVLIIDDDKMLCEMLSFKIESMGHSTKCAGTLKDGLKEALSIQYDIVFLDVRLPDGNGLQALPRIRATSSVPEVIIITGEGSSGGAKLAIESGAWDYIEKPLSAMGIALQLTRALQYRENKIPEKVPTLLKREGIIGESRELGKCLEFVAKAANSHANVLITGETGTGKELFAKAIHSNSSRADRALVVVDCAALPDTLVESMLFGHEKGAFTGADSTREPILYPKHLPDSIRLHVAESLMEKSKTTPSAEHLRERPVPPRTTPRYREFREAVLSESEKRYFQDLIPLSQYRYTPTQVIDKSVVMIVSPCWHVY